MQAALARSQRGCSARVVHCTNYVGTRDTASSRGSERTDENVVLKHPCALESVHLGRCVVGPSLSARTRIEQDGKALCGSGLCLHRPNARMATAAEPQQPMQMLCSGTSSLTCSQYFVGLPC